MKLPDRCPSCRGALRVTELVCDQCATSVAGKFTVCSFCALSEEDRSLLDLFLRARGNVKDVERGLGVSYPTVRARLDQLWVRLGYRAPDVEERETPEDILRALREGSLDVTEAEDRLRRATREDDA